MPWIAAERVDQMAEEQFPEPPISRPWGVQAIGDMYHDGVAAGLPDGRWVAAVAEHYHCNPIESIRAAWWVLTGRAVAFIWPKAGDLEDALKVKGYRRPTVDQIAEEKRTRNARVQARYDELMSAGKHGHYETLFRIVREEVETDRAAR